MPSTLSTRRAPRQQRSIRNDERILDSAVAILDEEGWGELAISRVARRAGLNPSTVGARYLNRQELAAAAWQHRLAGPLMQSLRPLAEACDGRPVSGPALFHLLDPFMYPDATTRAAIEILVVAAYEPVIAQAVHDTIGPQLTEWLVHARSTASRAKAARHALLIATGLGFVLESRRWAGLDADFSAELHGLADALSHPTAPVRLPSARAEGLDAPLEPGTGNEAWDAALRATVACVGERGYESATIEAITAASGYSRTVIFARYPTKLDLFMDATDRMLADSVRAGMAYQELLAGHGPGIADTCYLRELMRPERTSLRTLTLEQVRLAPHHERLRSAIRDALLDAQRMLAQLQPNASPPAIRGRMITETAVTTGTGLVAQLQPDAWSLPFDTVLVPWFTQKSATHESAAHESAAH
ncbi:MAG: TetR/AcrR family transcriptional regulator [Actinomycetales bacterium]|nr:TetR/AcrR family transcriptional regulator [Actinomycetales bacterium]